MVVVVALRTEEGKRHRVSFVSHGTTEMKERLEAEKYASSSLANTQSSVSYWQHAFM